MYLFAETDLLSVGTIPRCPRVLSQADSYSSSPDKYNVLDSKF
jgi:hypothetical protein